MKSIVTPDTNAIEKAVEVLKQGGLVAIPTETVYGLGADASNPDAIKKIFAAKGRPENHPLIVHIGNIEQLNDWALDIPDSAFRLAKQFWPGPLTLILKKRPEVPLEITGGQDTVGLRIPNNPVALALLKSFGGGIAAPSANRFKHISPTSAHHVLEELGSAVDLILDGGSCTVGVESTIIDLSGSQPRLLRPGHISISDLESVLKEKVCLDNKSEIRSPGMMEVHYAPTTQTLLCSKNQLPALLKELSEKGKTVGILSYQYHPTNKNITVIKMPELQTQYAQFLYASLREMDQLNLGVIIVEQPPQNEAWRAVNDRLSKATV